MTAATALLDALASDPSGAACFSWFGGLGGSAPLRRRLQQQQPGGGSPAPASPDPDLAAYPPPDGYCYLSHAYDPSPGAACYQQQSASGCAAAGACTWQQARGACGGWALQRGTANRQPC